MSFSLQTGKSKFAARIGAAVLSVAVLGTSVFGTSSISSYLAADVNAVTTDYGLAKTSQEGVILHCWNWSYNNIKKYMKDIAAAGYTSVQTSPVQQPKDYYWDGVAYGNVGIPNGTGGEDGNWWKLYQPVTFSICNNGYTWLGNKAEFKAMCAEAEKYGVKVIVDIVANHMGNVKGYKIGDVETVMGDISPQVGEFWKQDMLTDSSYWHISTTWTHSSDGRFDVTQGNMGMPDLNTGDKKVQKMVLDLLKECIDCGADGFRFDAAKHIETPADAASFRSDFWDVVLDGARSYYKTVNGNDGVYFYGEVLNRLDDTNAENYYLSKMSITDNSTSDNLRNSVVNKQVSALAQSNYCSYIHGKANRAVMWAESHDTYMGGGSSYDANDSDIKKTWAILASRKDATALFFARPYYSKDILANDVSKARQSIATIMENIEEQTQIGDVGSLTWADPAVVAANRFRNFFIGQSEKLGSSGNTAYNVRGNKGVVIVRGEGPGSVSINLGMTDGTYTDQVTGEKFTVSGGTISGKITNKDGIAVIYNPTVDYGKVNPEEPTVLKISASTPDKKTSFSTDTVDVTLTVKGAASASYTTSEGAKGSFTTSTTIRIGSTIAADESVTVTITAKAADGTTKQKSYKFTKKGARTGYPTLSGPGVVFDNETEGFNWDNVYCYVYYNEGEKKNAGWPGLKMTEKSGNYWTYEFPSSLFGSSDTVYVIFNNGSGTQFPSGQGLRMIANEKKLYQGGSSLVDLPDNPDPQLSVKLTASKNSINLGDTITLSASASGNSGSVSYTFTCSDGTTIRSKSTASTCTWKPSKAGTFVVTVKAEDSSSSATAKTTVKVIQPDVTLKNTSALSASEISLGSSVTVNCSATGGTGTLKYAVYYKKDSDTKWATLQDYSTTKTVTLKPAKAVAYTVCVKVIDGNKNLSKVYLPLTVKEVTLNNTSVLSASEITLGSSVTVKCSATGGTGTLKYAVYYKKDSDTKWATLQDYSTTKTVTLKPAKAVAYTVCVKVIDGNKNLSKVYLPLTVKKVTLKNTSVLSESTITLGNQTTVKASATGGTGTLKYAVYYKKDTDTKWATLQDYSTTKTIILKPAKAVSYNVCVKVIDGSKTVSKVYLPLKVTTLTNSSKISATNIILGNSVKVTASASGGAGTYKYAVYYKKTSDTKWATAQDYSTNKNVTIKPSKAVSYDICVKVKDKSGDVVKKYYTVKVKTY